MHADSVGPYTIRLIPTCNSRRKHAAQGCPVTYAVHPRKSHRANATALSSAWMNQSYFSGRVSGTSSFGNPATGPLYPVEITRLSADTSTHPCRVFGSG